MSVIRRREAILREAENDLRRLLGDDHGMGEEFLADVAEQVVGGLADQHAGAVEENDRLRSTIEQLTMDRDSWKVLAGELTEQRDELRREFEGRLVCEELEWGLREQDWDGCVW